MIDKKIKIIWSKLIHFIIYIVYSHLKTNAKKKHDNIKTNHLYILQSIYIYIYIYYSNKQLIIKHGIVFLSRTFFSLQNYDRKKPIKQLVQFLFLSKIFCKPFITKLNTRHMTLSSLIMQLTSATSHVYIQKCFFLLEELCDFLRRQ